MTTQQINEAIAKACGCEGLFTEDTDAMHKAEGTCLWHNNVLWQVYVDKLGKLSPSLAPALHATARQRAEAFLRTLNLWEEK